MNDFTFDHVRNKQEEITQRLKIKLLLWKEEWFLDRDYGIPYKQEILVKGVDRDDIDDIFRLAISEESGVIEILSYSSDWDRTTREFRINTKIRTDSGDILPLSLAL